MKNIFTLLNSFLIKLCSNIPKLNTPIVIYCIITLGINNNFTDVLYNKQIQKISKAKKDKLVLINSIENSESSKIDKLVFHPSYFLTWEINSFDSDIIFREETPIISKKIFYEF